jgi:hypothetical protein
MAKSTLTFQTGKKRKISSEACYPLPLFSGTNKNLGVVHFENFNAARIFDCIPPSTLKNISIEHCLPTNSLIFP